MKDNSFRISAKELEEVGIRMARLVASNCPTFNINPTMYVDIDSNNKISIHNITPEEALSVATILLNTPLCNSPTINNLGKQLLSEADKALENEEQQ